MVAMGYSAYLDPKSDLSLLDSPSESHASGLQVGRLNVPLGAHVDGALIARSVAASRYDLIIVRYPSKFVQLAAELQNAHLCILQADTLLYFAAEKSIDPHSTRNQHLQELRIDDAVEARAVIAQVFAGYANHYAANPVLSGINILDAYQDWVVNALASPDVQVQLIMSEQSQSVGICVVDTSHKDFDEVLIAGIHPQHQRQGLYTAMMRVVINQSLARGKPRVVISTQSSNTGVMRAWCRIGLEPILSLNTLHVTSAVAH